MREGVRLSPLKARIFDLVKRAGVEGIDGDEINRIAFDGNTTRRNVKAHIHQINELLASTDWRIVGARGGNHRTECTWPYHLIRARS